MGHRVGVGATSEHLVSGLQLEDEPLSRNGLHRDLGAASAEVSMEPDLDGRTVRGLQSRHEGLSETYREEFSDLGHLGLDPLCEKALGHSLPLKSVFSRW